MTTKGPTAEAPLGEAVALHEPIGVIARLLRLWRAVLGPAAVTAAGMIGAGAVSTRLLGGAWFGFELLWAALYVIPLVIFTLDSASRIGILNDGRGLLDMIRTELSPLLAWGLFLTQVPLNLVVNMSQISVAAEAAVGLGGGTMSPENTLGRLLIGGIIVTLSLTLFTRGGFSRTTKVMTQLLLAILVCFVIVAVRGLMEPETWRGLFGGLWPRIPQDVPVRNGDGARSGFTQLMAIAGQALPAAVFLSYGYFTGNANYKEKHLRENLRKTVLNLGLIWGLFSVVVVVAGVTALHEVYTGDPLHYSQIATVSQAGAVMAPALPAFLSGLATPVFSLGLLVAAFTTWISVALTMTYFTLDMLKLDWRMREGNQAFHRVFAFYVVVPALLAPFWKLPALLQAIIAMAGNLLVTPLVLALIFYFINRKRYVGQHTASMGRNLVLAATFSFSLFVVGRGAFELWGQLAN